MIENNSMVKAVNKALVGKGASRRLHQRCVGRFVFIVSDSAKNINDSITFIRENVRMQHQTTKNRPHREYRFKPKKVTLAFQTSKCTSSLKSVRTTKNFSQ